MVIILLIGVGYFTFVKKSVVNNETVLPIMTETPTENEVIQLLLSSWKATQSKFVAKAGESGTFNAPSKIQFIAADTMLINYDDGLVDHISILQFQDNSLVELKRVGTMMRLTQSEWQALVKTYGDPAYPVSNYESSDYALFTKVAGNIFVK